MPRDYIFKIVCFIGVAVCVTQAFCQSTDEAVVSIIADESSVEATSEDLVEQLHRIQLSPLDINALTIEELDIFPFLTDFQKQSIVFYIQKNKPIYSIYEIQLALGIDEKTANLLFPFLKVANADTVSIPKFDSIRYVHHDILIKSKYQLQKDSKFPEGDDNIGTPDYQKIKYTIEAHNFATAGFVLEKDRGEQYYDGGYMPYDFQSGYVKVEKLGYCKQIIVGDYHARFGQGLLAWTGFSMSKSANSTTIRKSAVSFSPYSSTDEQRFFRGIAADFACGKFVFSSGISQQHIDAGFDSLLNAVISIPETGYHTTENELSKKDMLLQRSLLARLGYEGSTYKIHINSASHFWDKRLMLTRELYRKFYMQGTQLQNYSFDYGFAYKNIVCFGEHAVDNTLATAALHGISCMPIDDISLSVVYRNYDKAYNSIYTSAFGEYGEVKNEEGVYCGVQLQLIPNVEISAYYDIFTAPWLRFNASAKSQGNEFLSSVKWTVSDDCDVKIQYRCENKTQNIPDSLFAKVGTRVLQNFRTQIVNRISDKVLLSTNMVYGAAQLQTRNETGCYIAQDVSIAFAERRRLLIRGAYFNATDFSSIYAYENDLVYSFSVPQFIGKGVKLYCVFRCNIGSKLVFETKIAHAIKEAESMVPGFYENYQTTDISAQLRISL